MKKIEIHGGHELYNPSSFGFGVIYGTAGWAICDKDPNDRVVILHSPCYCRESLVANFSELWECSQLYNKRNKLRLLNRVVVSNSSKSTAFEDGCKNGLKNVNLIEDHYGWPLTKMYEAIPTFKTSKARKVKALLFVATNRWRRSPHMLSLFCLLIRTGRRRDVSKVKTYDTLVKACGRISAKGGDGHYLNQSSKYWPILFGRTNELFRGMTVTELYENKNYSKNTNLANGYTMVALDGISRLCSATGSNNAKLNKRFKNMKAKYYERGND